MRLIQKIIPFLGISLLIYFIASSNIALLINDIQNISLLFIFLAFILNLPLIFIKSYRWKKLLDYSLKIRIGKIFEFYFASVYYGIVTPGRIGEFVKVLYLKKNNNEFKLGEVFASIVMDRLLDLYFLLFVSFVAILLLSQNFELSGFFIAICFFLVAPIVIRFSCLKNILKYISQRLGRKFSTEVKKFSSDFIGMFKNFLSISKLFHYIVITALAYLIFYFQVYLIALGVGLDISFFELLLIISITNLISLLPISIGGLGTREAVLLFYLLPQGYTQEIVVLFSLIVFLVFFVGCGLVGFMYSLKNPINLKALY